MTEEIKMERRRKKPNSFAVVPTKNGKNIVIELRDLEECGRPSVQKDIHLAMRRCLNRMINRSNELKELTDAIREQTPSL